MIKILPVILIVLIVSPLVAYAAKTTYGDLPAKFVRNYDGDTITVDIPNVHPLLGSHISVRVRGIDTPEIKGKCESEKAMAQEAKKLVFRVLRKAHHIVLKNVGRPKYFRILANVEADGVDISQLLLSKRLARPYWGGHKQSWCK